MRHKNSKYSLNERYFENIDSEEKAYWLGMLTADGCVYQKSGVSQVTLALKGADAKHVEKFGVAVGTNKKVTMSQSKLKGKIYPKARLTICSKEMANDLITLGVKQRKSLTAVAWSGPEHLMIAYWRGVVDGDGWISDKDSTSRKESHAVGLCGSKSMVDAFSQWVSRHLGLNVKPQPKGKIYTVDFGGTFAPQKLANLLYQNAGTYLDRKYEQAVALINKQFQVGKFAPRSDVLDFDIIEQYRLLRSTRAVAKHFNMDRKSIITRLRNNDVELRKTRWDGTKKSGLLASRVSAEELTLSSIMQLTSGECMT